MKIALFPNFEKEGTKKLLDLSLSILSQGAECTVADDNTDEEKLYKENDIIISIGGDGTLIKHAKAASAFSAHCLGINTGRLGFLANLEEKDFSYLKELLNGNYTVESRMMLSIEAEKRRKTVYSGTALNDIVVSSGSIAKLTDIKMTVSGDEIDYRADGIIFSTPTGSTAYSLSAGGPIIDPNVRCISVTPICSHSLTARPLMASESADISVSLLDTSRTDAHLTVDGVHCADVDKSTIIKVKRSDYDAKFINLTGSTIYKTLSYKF